MQTLWPCNRWLGVHWYSKRHVWLKTSQKNSQCTSYQMPCPTWILPMPVHTQPLETCMASHHFCACCQWLWHQIHWGTTCHPSLANTTAWVWGISWMEWHPFLCPNDQMGLWQTNMQNQHVKLHPKGTHQISTPCPNQTMTLSPKDIKYIQMSWVYFSTMHDLMTPHWLLPSVSLSPAKPRAPKLWNRPAINSWTMLPHTPISPSGS